MKLQKIRIPAKHVVAALIALSVCLMLCAVQGTSLWVDEIQNYSIVKSDTVFALFRKVFAAGGAVSSMPLYFIMEWAATRILGDSEIALRALNFPFALLYLAAIYKIYTSKANETPAVFSVLLILHPVILYYMNEARPYIALLALGAWFFYYLYFTEISKPKSTRMLWLIYCIGLATHMMFAFILIAYLLYLLPALLHRRESCWAVLRAAWPFCIVCLLIGLYYATVLVNAPEIGGSNAGGASSVAQILYSFLGFGGIALSRNDLREMRLSSLTPVMLVCCAALLAAYAVLLLGPLVRMLKTNQRFKAMLLAFAGTLALFVLCNLVLQTRFWERHIIWLLPLFLCLLGMALSSMWKGALVQKIAVVVCLLLMVVSSVNIVFKPYYKKEDYKGVANYIRQLAPSEAGPVFIQGASVCYAYYQLSVSEDTAPGDITTKFRATSAGIYGINHATYDEIDALFRAYPGAVVILSDKKDYGDYRINDRFADLMFEQFSGFRLYAAPEESL